MSTFDIRDSPEFGLSTKAKAVAVSLLAATAAASGAQPTLQQCKKLACQAGQEGHINLSEYRTRIMAPSHPDKGGTNERFIDSTECKQILFSNKANVVQCPIEKPPPPPPPRPRAPRPGKSPASPPPREKVPEDTEERESDTLNAAAVAAAALAGVGLTAAATMRKIQKRRTEEAKERALLERRHESTKMLAEVSEELATLLAIKKQVDELRRMRTLAE
jgi:hypothetical protein